MEGNRISIFENYAVMSILLPYFGYTDEGFILLSSLDVRSREKLDNHYEEFRNFMARYCNTRCVESWSNKFPPCDLFRYNINIDALTNFIRFIKTQKGCYFNGHYMHTKIKADDIVAINGEIEQVYPLIEKLKEIEITNDLDFSIELNKVSLFHKIVWKIKIESKNDLHIFEELAIKSKCDSILKLLLNNSSVSRENVLKTDPTVNIKRVIIESNNSVPSILELFSNSEIKFERIGDVSPSQLNDMIVSKLYQNRIKSLSILLNNDEDITAFNELSPNCNEIGIKHFQISCKKYKKSLNTILSNLPDGSTLEIKSRSYDETYSIFSFTDSVIRMHDKDKYFMMHCKTFTFKTDCSDYYCPGECCSFSEDPKYSEYVALNLNENCSFIIEDIKLMQPQKEIFKDELYWDNFISKQNKECTIVIPLKKLCFSKIYFNKNYIDELHTYHWNEKLK